MDYSERTSILSTTTLPTYVLANIPAQVPTQEERQQSLLKQLDKRITKACTNYEKDQKLVNFSYKTEKITSFFITSANYTSGAQSTFHTTVGQKLEQLQQMFSEALTGREQQAREAFASEDYFEAEQEFLKLLQVISPERDHNRSFHLKSCLLATKLKQDCIREAIDLYLELKKTQNIDKKLFSQLEGYKTIIENHIQQLCKENEKSISDCIAQFATANQKLQQIFTQKTLDFEIKMKGIQEITSCIYKAKQTLLACFHQKNTLEKFCTKLSIKYESNYDKGEEARKQVKDLTKKATTLIDTLMKSGAKSAQNDYLSAWIEQSISSYSPQEEAPLPALYTWALWLLGEFFFSNQLTDESLNESIKLLRKQASCLLAYSQEFPKDVQLKTGPLTLQTSLLFLAAISDYIKKEYGNANAIASLKRWTFSGVLNSLPLVGSSASLQNPLIDLQQAISTTVSSIKNPSHILQNLLQAFCTNNSSSSSILIAEDIVALFEMASDLLNMPRVISDLLLKSKNTPELQETLSASQWLRLMQATQSSLPYARLKTLFDPLSKEQFLEWIGLYNERKLKIDETKQHLLFLSLFDVAKTFLQERNPLPEDKKIFLFTFFTELYESVDPDFLRIEELDSRLLQLCCLCQVHTFSKLHLDLVTYFDERALMEVGPSKEDLDWIQTYVLPSIKKLDLTSSLSEKRIDFFKACTELKRLKVFHHGEQEPYNWQNLKVFSTLTVLTICSSPVDLFQLNDIPLLKLHLSQIDGYLDFSRCPKLTSRLEGLFLSNAQVTKGSLSWVSASKKLKVLVIKNSTSEIGSLAPKKLPHSCPTLEKLVLKNIDGSDKELFDSLPSLIASQSSITSITCQSTNFTGSILELIKGAHLAQKVAIQLTIEDQSLEALDEFSQLKKLSFFIHRTKNSGQDLVNHIVQHDFTTCPLPLESCKCIVTGESPMTLQLPTKKKAQ